jgi:hypothetical protein
MTNKIQKDSAPEVEEIEPLEELAEENDYGFIIGPDGELKHMFTPNEFHLDPPPVVKKILKLLGIKDINQLDFETDGTLH